jgi:predicted DCC family thiol-disulfide oxidoreductase YuxK
MVDTPRRTIFFDGECPLCSREIEMFQRRVTDGSLAYVDISDPKFQPAEFGVDAKLVHRQMHVRNDETGRMMIGLDALIAMWECVPGFRWLATLNRRPVFRQLGQVGYAIFAWIRPKLPKRKRDRCETTCPVATLEKQV